VKDVFVGRKAELAQFDEATARVRQRQPWMLTIEGDSGVGKTALARRCVASSPGLNAWGLGGFKSQEGLGGLLPSPRRVHRRSRAVATSGVTTTVSPLTGDHQPPPSGHQA